jgi:hypothetical protein
MTYREAYLTTPAEVPGMQRAQIERMRYVINSIRGFLLEHGRKAMPGLNRQLPKGVGLAESKTHTLALLTAC